MKMTRRLLLFAHDPGGANTLIPLVAPMRESGAEVLLCGKGPALARYAAAGLDADTWEVEIETQVAGKLRDIRPDLVLTGTSSDDFTEKFLWRQAKELGIPSAAILDHWINYGIRFSEWPLSRKAAYEANPVHAFLPDRIFVMDDFARQEMMAAGLPGERLVVTGQPYFEQVRRGLEAIPGDHRWQVRRNLGLRGCEQVVTFVSEPLTQLYDNAQAEFGYTEHTVFAALAGALAEAAPQAGVILKLHPRENPDSYPAVSENGLTIVTDQSHTPWEIIDTSDLLVGMSSMMLIEAMIARKPVLSAQIGLNCRESPFMPARRGWINPVLTSEDLRTELLAWGAGGLKVPESMPFAENPVGRVLAEIGAMTAARV